MIFNVTGGGGAALNFKVVAYATEEALLAATPAENTIGIITGTPITSYIFSAEEPSPAAAGMIWITVGVGTASSVKFNALKKNTVMVYPLSAKQYVDGAWTDVTAMSYQGGEWVNWATYLYNQGNEYTSLTGGWVGRRPSGYFNSDGTVTKNTSSITATAGRYQYIAAMTTNKIDLSDYNTLFFDVVSAKKGGAAYAFLCVFTDAFTNADAVVVVPTSSVVIGINQMDISAITGEYYVGFGVAADDATAFLEVSEVALT